MKGCCRVETLKHSSSSSYQNVIGMGFDNLVRNSDDETFISLFRRVALHAIKRTCESKMKTMVQMARDVRRNGKKKVNSKCQEKDKLNINLHSFYIFSVFFSLSFSAPTPNEDVVTGKMLPLLAASKASGFVSWWH